MTKRTASDPGGTRSSRFARRVWSFLPGLLVAGLGVVFLLDSLDVVDSGQMLHPIVAGVHSLWDELPKLMVIVPGGRLLFGGLLGALVGGDLWPLILVAIGLLMLIFLGKRTPAPHDGTDAGENCFAILSSVERRNRSADFRGGSASAFLGGVHLDLTGADIAGNEAVLHVSAVMGGVEIRIPEDWTTEVRLTPILADIEDKTRGPAAASRRLVVEGAVFMGGLEIGN